MVEKPPPPIFIWYLKACCPNAHVAVLVCAVALVYVLQFLSGGMSELQATEALNEINKLEAKKPWSLTFSYGRALQQTVLKTWLGKAENVAAAQAALLVRAKANSEANLGTWAGEAAGGAAGESLHVANYTY